MAINVVTSPATNASAHDSIIWKFQFTSLGSPPNQKRMNYYLADSSGNRLSETYTWTPKSTAEVLTVDVGPIVRSILSTVFPSCNISVQNDSTVVKGIKIYYGESTFNTTTCADVVSPDNETSVVYAWNTALNNDSASDFVFSGGKTGVIMNSYPSKIRWSPDSEPYLWYAGAGVVQITFYTSAGVSLGTTSHSMLGAATAKYVSLDWRCYSVASRPASALLEVNDGTGYKNTLIVYDVCSCRDFYTGITFLDPKGGRSHISLNCPKDISIQREGSEVTQYISGFSATTKGRSFFNPKASDQIKVQAVIGNTYEDLAFARALLASPGHHILRMNAAGSNTWYKFILQGGTYNVIKDREELLIDITGFIAEEKGGQKIDI